MIDVVDAAQKAAGEKDFDETLAGEKAFNQTGEWLPEATLDATDRSCFNQGPLTTPVGGGIRSLNVALRQKLDLFACVRPVRWYEHSISVRSPKDVDKIIFRETEDGNRNRREATLKVIKFLIS